MEASIETFGKRTSWEPCGCSVAQRKVHPHFTGLCQACTLSRATKWQKKDLWLFLSPRTGEMNKAAKPSWGLLHCVSPSCPSQSYLTSSILSSDPSVIPLQYGTFPWSLLGPGLRKGWKQLLPLLVPPRRETSLQQPPTALQEKNMSFQFLADKGVILQATEMVNIHSRNKSYQIRFSKPLSKWDSSA